MLPLLVGAVLLVILDQGRGPRQGTLARTLLRGYPYTLGLALTLAIMIVFAPLARLRHLARRWTTVHVPIIIEDDDYLGVVQDIQHALGAAGIRTDARPAPAVLRFSRRALAALSGRQARSRAADALAVLLAPDAEILVHPADLVIGAAPRAAARLRATLALRLTYTKAHLTYSQEAHEVEDELRTLWEAAGDHTGHREDLAVLRTIEARVGVLEIDFEEWEILQRQILLLDRHLRAEIDPMAADEREPVIRQAMSALGRTLARAAVQTVRTLVNDGRGVAVKPPRGGDADGPGAARGDGSRGHA